MDINWGEAFKVGITALTTIVGWWAVHQFTKRREDRAQRRAAELARVNQQIAELYAPLLGFVEMITTAHSNRQKLLSQLTGGGDRDKAAADQAEAKRHYFDKSFRPLHIQITSLLQTKRHLLLGGRMPASFEQYLKHAEQDLSLFELWKEKGITGPFPEGRVRWPHDFKSDIDAGLAELRKELARLEQQPSR